MWAPDFWMDQFFSVHIFMRAAGENEKKKTAV
jgi:hypothetical protein